VVNFTKQRKTTLIMSKKGQLHPRPIQGRRYDNCSGGDGGVEMVLARLKKFVGGDEGSKK